MIAETLRDSIKRKAIVLGAFLGSGTTILAAQKIGRIGRGVELDPYYVDLAINRIAQACGKRAIDDAGSTFETVKAKRAKEA